MSARKRVAVIGAGGSGLPAVKSCLDEGLTPVCFERTDHIGGLWYYTDTVTDGQGSVMRSTVVNTSKETMSYSDFPAPVEFAPYMHHSRVLEYLEMYGDSFDARSYIRFGVEVLSVAKNERYDETGQWDVVTKDKATGVVETSVFDGVMICTGHHADKYVPDFAGLESFQGKVLHGQDYRHSDGYEGKRVVVVGIGNSGVDIASELSRCASQVYLSTRRGTWLVPRVFDRGLPIDLVLSRRVTYSFRDLHPKISALINAFVERRLNQRFDHDLYGLTPRERFLDLQPTMTDELQQRILTGTAIIKPDVRRIGPGSVEFADGSVVEDVDAVILATGYKFGFPFVEDPALSVHDNEVDLYKYVFPPSHQHGTLAVIGCIVASGSILPIAEIQSRWVAKVFKGEVRLPSQVEMSTDVWRKRNHLKATTAVGSKRYTIKIDNLTYSDEIASIFGCKPNFGRMLISDPRLALACVFGPFTFYQYRLVGPSRWSGARQAILTVWDRSLAPTRTQPVHRKHTTRTVSDVAVVGVGLLLAVVLAWIVL